MSGSREPPDQQRFTFRQKWGDDFFASRGHTQVPNALLEFGAQLGLEPAEIGLLSHILYYKWDAAHPRPTIELLAARLGKSERAVRRYLRAIEEKGLLTIRPCYDDNGRQDANELDFTPLRARINHLQSHVTDMSQGRVSDLSSSSLSDLSPSSLSDLSGSKDSDVVLPDTYTTRQQHPRTSAESRTSSAPDLLDSSPRGLVVAIQDQVETEGNDLLPALKELGVTSSTGHRLLGRYSTQHVGRWLRYAKHKLSDGWVPHETPAAWLVAAIRSEDWTLPAWFEALEEEASESYDLAAAERRRLEQERDKERRLDAEQRKQIESQLGIDAKTRNLWDRARTLLEERREMSPALLSAYLLPVEDKEAVIVTPVKFFCSLIEGEAKLIRQALQEAGKKRIAKVCVEHRGDLVGK